MNKKIKILLVLLGVVSLLAVGLAVWIFLSAQIEVQRYAEEQTELEKERASLKAKADTAQEETRRWKEKSESITETLNKLSREHTLLTRQYDSILTEKETLTAQNKSLSEQLEELDELYSQARVQKKPEIPETSDAYLASLLKQKAALEVEVESLKKSIAHQEARMQEIQLEARPVTLLEKEKEVLEKKLHEAERMADVLSNDLVAERRRYSTLQKEMARMDGKFQRIATERDELADQVVKMKVVLEQRIDDLAQTKSLLESVVKATREPLVRKESTATGETAIELPPIVVKAEEEKKVLPEIPQKVLTNISPRAPSIVPKRKEETATKATTEAKEQNKSLAKLSGRIITVNDTHRFVVIDIGQEHGVSAGMSFDVYRLEEKVGKLEVIEARKNITACDIKEKKVHSLHVGDVVRQ